ncbi:MAG: hypothetical protein BGO31_07625 [Bacteroidetes bacterium 43-16]|nr:MAG: hypothetical protein BGO31_07625 [Bacteroidetes bacterium 43-16]
MKVYLFVIVILLSFMNNIHAQGENSIWMFGRNYSLDFNQLPPLLRDDRYINGTLMANTSQTVMPNIEHFYDYAQAVCDANGSILFMVKKHVYRNSGLGYSIPAPNIFDRNEQPIEGTEFLPPSDMQEDRPIVIPHPGNINQYYVFYVRNGGLLYCLFDMTLNNGRGNIVPGFKNILHYGYNSIVGRSMVAIQDCDGIWLVLRHKTQNQFLSFKLDIAGLHANPTTSQTGLMQIAEYASLNEFVASPDGKLIAVVKGEVQHLNQPGGIELFDFEKCSGKINNARLFEMNQQVYGVGFSPDNNKLYAAYTEYNPLLTPMASWWRDQNLYQFDLSLNEVSAIVNSKTLVMTNPTIQRNMTFCPLETPALGSMRIGKDGKMYFTNGSPSVCIGTSGVGLAIHIINNPNLPGLACNPTINAIFNTVNGMVAGNRASFRTDFSYEIVLPPNFTPDTIINEPIHVHVCYRADTVLKAPIGVGCVTWSNGLTDSNITVSVSGKYWVRYTKDCTIYIDTFDVSFSKLPKVLPVQYGCPGYILLTAGEIDGPKFELEVYNENGGKIYGGHLQSLHHVFNLIEGNYLIKVSTESACDTFLKVELKAYPTEEISIDPPFAIVKYGEQIQLTAYGGISYIWTPATSLNTRTGHLVIATPEVDTEYEIIGVNDYGCRDTAYATIKVDFNKQIQMPNAFSPNGDGLNDIFTIPSGKWNILKFEVYNRYGQLIYQKNNLSEGWNGMFNGKTCDAGVYFYAIVLSMPDKTNYKLSGEVHLIK